MLAIIKPRFLFTPIAIGWEQFLAAEGYNPIEQKSLYIFGFRLITWRTDK